MTEARKLTPKAIANQMMADEAWHDTLYVRAEHYDLLKAENERLREGLAEAEAVRERCNERAFRLESENERLREENERYRWLQANALLIDLVFDPDNFVRVYVGTDPVRFFRGKTLDDAVSEAMKEAALRGEGT